MCDTDRDTTALRCVGCLPRYLCGLAGCEGADADHARRHDLAALFSSSAADDLPLAATVVEGRALCPHCLAASPAGTAIVAAAAPPTAPTAPDSADRLVLWAHLVSSHAAGVALTASAAELEAAHAHEHAGPGTIRNHPVGDRSAEPAKMARVLVELG